MTFYRSYQLSRKSTEDFLFDSVCLFSTYTDSLTCLTKKKKNYDIESESSKEVFIRTPQYLIRHFQLFDIDAHD